ncbi:MAG: protein kinase domain-containing protein [Planctomycetota bacterium]|jgi:WD40 repeat protein/serine/threonine protein kinase
MNERAKATRVQDDADQVLVDLMEQMTQKVQLGEAVDLETYVRKHPRYADQLRRMSLTLQVLGDLARSSTGVTGASGAPITGSPVTEGILGDYRILREIGRGGMGVVYEAEQISLRRRVALKVLPFAAVLDHRQLQRFKNEAHAAAQLHHTNIVPVHSVGCDRGVHYYAMQYIEGQTLSQLIHDLQPLEGFDGKPPAEAGRKGAVEPADSLAARRLAAPVTKCDPDDVTVPYAEQDTPTAGPPSETAEGPQAAISTERSTKSPAYFRSIAKLALQAADALEHAHQEGVVHRDVKPSNLILDARGKLWVTDFGLARVEGDPGMTMTGDILGTLRYMSPEQALAKRVVVDHRTDIYSLGVTLYELLTLRPAYSGDDRQELLRQIAFEEPRPPRRVNKAIPVELETIVLKAAAKNPAERYATAQEFADDLGRFLEDKPVQAQRITLTQRLAKWSRRHRPLVASMAAALAIVLVVIAVAGVVIAKQQQEIADQERAGRITAETLLSVSYIDRGQALAEQGEVGRGMLWFARSLQVAPDDADDPRRLARANLAVWRRHLHGLRLLVHHEGQVRAVAFTPDGSRILAGGSDGTVRLWEAATGQPVGSPLKHKAPVTALAVSPDGSRIVAACEDGTVRLWNASKLEPIGKPIEHEGRVRGVVFNRDGSQIVTVGGDDAIRTWDVNELQPVGEPLKPGYPHVIAATSAGLRALVKVQHNRCQLWDIDRREAIGQDWEHTWWPRAISPDGSKFVATRPGVLMRFWEAETGKPATPEIRQGGTVYALAVSPDGSRIVSGGNTRAAIVWDAATGEPVGAPLRQQRSDILALTFSHDGTRILVGSADGTVRLWDVARDTSRGKRIQHEDHVLAAAFSRDGLRILTEQDGMAQLRDAGTGKAVSKPFKSRGIEGRLVFSPDGSLVLTKRPWWGPVRDVVTGEPIGRTPDPTYGFAFSPDSSRFVTGSQRDTQLWDARTGEPIATLFHHDRPVAGAAFSPDGSRILTGGYDGTTRLWDAATQKPIGEPLDHHSEVKSLAWSPDGARMLVGLADGTARLWDLATLKPVGVPLQHQEIVNGVAFSPDGSRLATCSLDRTARLWDAATLKPLGPLMKHDGMWVKVSFSPDGSQLLVTNGREANHLWAVPPRSVVGGPDRIVLWTQVVTGLELDETGGIRVLDSSDWQKRYDQLQKLGGPPAAEREAAGDPPGKPSVPR